MKALFCSLLLIASSTEALLPPLYEGAKEIASILSSPELGKKLPSGEQIDKIKRTESGFIIFTAHYRLRVDIEYQKSEMIGPAIYQLNFQEAQKI